MIKPWVLGMGCVLISRSRSFQTIFLAFALHRRPSGAVAGIVKQPQSVPTQIDGRCHDLR